MFYFWWEKYKAQHLSKGCLCWCSWRLSAGVRLFVFVFVVCMGARRSELKIAAAHGGVVKMWPRNPKIRNLLGYTVANSSFWLESYYRCELCLSLLKDTERAIALHFDFNVLYQDEISVKALIHLIIPTCCDKKQEMSCRVMIVIHLSFR